MVRACAMYHRLSTKRPSHKAGLRSAMRVAKADRLRPPDLDSARNAERYRLLEEEKMTTTWQREAVAWLRGKAAEQAQNNERWPEHAKCYPSWTERVETAQRLADDLEREAEEEST